jgi:branched-chain amino acid transport system permease protein
VLLGPYVSEYYYLATYTILQFIVLGTAWNILGGYGGYVNFGTAGFFAIGCYTTIVLNKIFPMPLFFEMLAAAVTAGLVGLGTGYLTLRLRGVFFSIATLALAIVLQTLVVNWSFVGGARGVYVIRPPISGVLMAFFGFFVPNGISYVQFLVVLMVALAMFAVLAAWAVEKSWIGVGLAAIRDDESAAETSGVPSLRLKLIATTMSGAIMGMAGAPFPYYVTYVDPATAFGLAIAVNSIAMPLVGGTATWWGPVVGAILLGSAQQILTVTISSAANLFIVGVLLVVFLTAAPRGVVGIVRSSNILEATGITKRFDGFAALTSVDFALLKGERVGLIGPNGSGKSTFVNCITGILAPDEGSITFDANDITKTPAWLRARRGLARTYQIPRPFRGMTIQENIEVPLRFAVGHKSARVISEAAQVILDQVGLGEKSDLSPKGLTQVELRKLELGRALAARPKVLIADEVMAGLSESEVDEILALLNRLNAEGISILLIEHIMRAVMLFSQRIVVIVAGCKIADGLPDDVMQQEEVERAYLGE